MRFFMLAMAFTASVITTNASAEVYQFKCKLKSGEGLRSFDLNDFRDYYEINGEQVKLVGNFFESSALPGGSFDIKPFYPYGMVIRRTYGPNWITYHCDWAQ